jgi:hypothetical protein
MPSQQLQGQLQKQHSADHINYIADKQNHKDKLYKASLGNRTVEELLFLPYTTKKSIMTIRTR